MSVEHWLAVRCCCTPTKILGFYRVTQAMIDARGFNVDGPRGVERVIIREITDYNRSELREINPNLPWTSTDPAVEMAIYSEERPIEFWRCIRGFVEIRSEGVPFVPTISRRHLDDLLAEQASGARRRT